jgi:putative ABC transport system substrate-binding protein
MWLSLTEPIDDDFRGALAKLGWTEGNNLRIELRWATSDADRTRTLTKELVDLRPDAMLGQTTPVTGALARETRTIPLVFVNVADPIASGFATSLRRPGGNVTGFALFESSMGGKWVKLLKEIAPRAVRVTLLFNPATAVPLKIYMPSIQAAASSFGIQASAAPVHAKDEIEGVIAAQARDPGGGLIVMPDSFTTANRELIIALAARYEQARNSCAANKRHKLPPPHPGGQDGSRSALDAALPRSGHGAAPRGAIVHRLAEVWIGQMGSGKELAHPKV